MHIICRRYILTLSVPHLCKVGLCPPSSYIGAAHGQELFSIQSISKTLESLSRMSVYVQSVPDSRSHDWKVTRGEHSTGRWLM